MEIYFLAVEPLWSGFGLILGACAGSVLAIVAYFKSGR
jgi:hypothetical protein